MLIHIAASKSGFRDYFEQYDAKTIILRPFWRFIGQTPLRNSVAIATPKIPDDQKLFERVCYMLKLKVAKFQLPTPPPLPSKIGLSTIYLDSCSFLWFELL